MRKSTMQRIDYEDFKKIDLRIGTIIEVEGFSNAKNPSYKIWIDLWPELWIKKSSAQITTFYKKADLIDTQVLRVCNLKPRQIADFMSEVLVTGFLAADGGIVLSTVQRKVPNGSKLH